MIVVDISAGGIPCRRAKPSTAIQTSLGVVGRAPV